MQIESQIALTILKASRFCKWSEFQRWAEKWTSETDRTEKSAKALKHLAWRKETEAVKENDARGLLIAHVVHYLCLACQAFINGKPQVISGVTISTVTLLYLVQLELCHLHP